MQKAVKLHRFELYHAALLIMFAVGCAVRLFGLGTVFFGLNQDEASIGYEAFAIANYGIDRNGVSWPAYLISWGSGQNAGYAYLLMPFVKLFGLTLTTLRLPMALVGCGSLYAMYTILKRSSDRRLALLGLFLFAICPWHILKSRWALESNLFPDLLLWGIALLCTGLATGKKRWFYLGFGVFGLSAWGYATSFVLLPLFLLPVLFVLWRRKTLKPLEILGCLGALLLTAWPIVLFAIITVFGLDTIQTPLFTIPAMPYGREGELAILSANPLAALLQNAKALFSMFISQADDYLHNGVPGFGIIYLISMPLAVVGFFRSVLPKQKGGKFRGLVPGDWLFLPLFAAALLLGLLVDSPNINRVNALWIPLIWYWILGAWELLTIDRLWQRVVPAVYLVLFLVFGYTLFGEHARQINDSRDGGVVQAVQFADSLGMDVYMETYDQTYSKILFALQIPPQEFRASITDEYKADYGTVLDFGKWHCYAAPEDASGRYASVFYGEDAEAYRTPGWRAEQFGVFLVVWPEE